MDGDNIPDALITVMKIFIIKEILDIIQGKIDNSMDDADTKGEEPEPITEDSKQLIESSVEKIKSDDKHPFKNPNFPKFLEKTEEEYQRLIESLKQNNDEYKSIFDLINNNKFDIKITGLESAVNERADPGEASTESADNVDATTTDTGTDSTTTDTGTDLPESSNELEGGGTIDIPMNNTTRDLLKVTTATKNGQLIQEFDTIFTQLDTAKLQAGYNEDQTIIKTFQMITSKLDAQISELTSFRDELEKKSWSGNVWPEDEQKEWSDSNLILIEYSEFNDRFNNFGTKWFKEWKTIRDKHKKQFEDEKTKILTAIKTMNSQAKYAMRQRQQDKLDALKKELNKKDTNPDLKSKIIAIIKDALSKRGKKMVLIHDELTKYNYMFNLEYNDEMIDLIFQLTNIDIEDKAYTVSTNTDITLKMTEKKENKEKFIYKLDMILGYLQYLSICYQLDGEITEETYKNVNKIASTPPQNLLLDEEKIKMICVMVGKKDTVVEGLINYTFNLLFNSILTNKNKYDDHCNYINYIALFLTSKQKLINELIRKKQEIRSDEGVGSLIDILLSNRFKEETDKPPEENATNYSTHIETALNEYIEIFNEYIAEQKNREELIKKQEIQELIDEERRNAEQEETENEIVSKNVRSLWNGEDGFKDIYSDRNNSQQTLTEDSWTTPDENNTYSFFGTKYFGMYLYLTIRYIRNKKDTLSFNLIEKYNFYLLIYRVFGNSEQKSKIFKDNNIITDNRNGFFAGTGYLDTVQRKIDEIRTKPIDESNSDFLKFHIEVMILYLMQKYKDVIKNKQEKIEMFLFSMFSLISMNSVKPKDSVTEKISLEVFYNDRILNRIKKGDETMGQILEESNKFVVGGRILEVEFDYHSVIVGLVDLIHKNLIFLNPLKALYKYVFSKINVIMRISDVQCAKRQGYKPRLINKLLVSQSGDSLLFSNIENDKIKIIEDKNKISADKQSSLKTFQFDFMNHIYGPNDSDDMMTDRINYGFMNLLKSYDNVPGTRWNDSILSSVYFTYGFSGSGKTYNTKNIIASLLAYIAENHSIVKKIDIRYSELVAATTPDSDVLMSGKDFNGPISNHASWQKFENDFGDVDLLNKYKAELLPYFFTKDSENYPPLVKSQDFVPFKKNNKLFDKVISLFDVWAISMDDKGGQWKNRIDGGYIRQIFVYNKKENEFHSLELGFSDQLHAKYWFEKFYGYSNKLQSKEDNTSNYDYENDEGYIGIVEPNKMFQEDIMNEENEIKEEGTTGFNFKKINLGLDFQDKTLLDYNYLPFDEWVLVNRHMPMRRQTFDDLNSFLQSGSDITWETNRNLVTPSGTEDRTIVAEREIVFDNVQEFVTGSDYDYKQNINNLFDTFKGKYENEKNKRISKWQIFNTHFIKAAQSIDKSISNMIDNPDAFNVNGRFKPMHFLTEPDNKEIEFKITTEPIKLFNNIELKISLEKHSSSNEFMIISKCDSDEKRYINDKISIIKKKPILADLAGGYQTVLTEYNQAKDALLAIIPGTPRGRERINEEIAKLENYPFTGQNFQLGDGNNLDNSADTKTYILFKRRYTDTKHSKITKLMERDGYDVVPHILVFNGQPLANLGMGDIGHGDTFLEKGYVVKGRADHLKQFYTNKEKWQSTTKALYLPFLYMKNQSPSSNKLTAFDFLDYALKHRGTNNYNSDYMSNRGGYNETGKFRLIREIEKVFAHSNDNLETKAIKFKQNVKDAFEKIDLHINILEIKPEYKKLLKNYRNAEERLDNYYKVETEKYMTEQGITSPIPENEWSRNGKSKTFEDLKAQVSVEINNMNNKNFVLYYFTNTDYFQGNGSNGENWKRDFANIRKQIIAQVKDKFLAHIEDGPPLDQDVTTGETFGDKINLIETDFKQFMDMIKDDYKPKVKEKYNFMTKIQEKIEEKWAEGPPDGLSLNDTNQLKMSQLQLRANLKKHIRKNLFSLENADEIIKENKIEVTVRAEQVTDIIEPDKYKHIHLLKEECRKTIKDILEKKLLYQDTVNRYFKFGGEKLELVKIKLEESKLLKLRKVEKTGQNIWEQVADDKFDDEFKNYWESSKKLGYTTESEDNFKKIQTQPQYINIYEKKEGDDTENRKSMNKKFKYHYDAVDTFKKTSATYNNDRSSRSHLVYEIRVGVIQQGYKMKYHNIIICDLAGKEDVISDEKMKEYIRNIYRGAIEEGAEFNRAPMPGGAGRKNLVKRAKRAEAERKAQEHAAKYDEFRPQRKNAMTQNENKPKMFSVVQEVKGKSVNDNDHPFTTQMNYLIEINDKYANDAKDPKPIFYNSEGDLKFADNFDINHPYILDLRGEGRMINATLENLENQLQGTNEYLAPLNSTFSYFRQLGKHARQKKNFNSLQNVASLPDSSSKLSEEYKQYGRILDRELNVQNYPKPWPNEGEIWDTKDNPNYKKYCGEWVDPSKKLQNKISLITKGKPPNYYILLAINLNDRSTESDIELKKVKVEGEEVWVDDIEGNEEKLKESASKRNSDLAHLGYESKTGDSDYYNFKSSSLLTTLNYIRNITTPINDDVTLEQRTDSITKLNLLNKRYLFCYNDKDKSLIPRIQSAEDSETREIIKYHPFNQKNYFDIQKTTGQEEKENNSNLMELDFANSSKNFERLKRIMDFDFLYLHPLNSNYVLLDDMDETAKALSEAALQAEATTAQNQRDIERERQRKMDEARKMQDNEALRIANEAIRARQKELGGKSKEFCKGTDFGRFASSKEECCELDGAISYGSNPPQMCDTTVDASDPAPPRADVDTDGKTGDADVDAPDPAPAPVDTDVVDTKVAAPVDTDVVDTKVAAPVDTDVVDGKTGDGKTGDVGDVDSDKQSDSDVSTTSDDPISDPDFSFKSDDRPDVSAQLKQKEDELREGQIAGKRSDINHMGNNLCSKAFNNKINPTFKNQYKKEEDKEEKAKLVNDKCSKLRGREVIENGYSFQCIRRTETPEETKYRVDSGLSPYRVKMVAKNGQKNINKKQRGCLVNNDKLFNEKNEATFKKQNRELFISGGGQQGGGGLVDQNYLFKINLLKHPWLNDSDYLSRFIENERAMTKCIQLDEEEKAAGIKFDKPFIEQIFTGGKRKTRKTRRKRNKSNKKKKKKIQIKNKSKKNRKKLKNKTRKK